MEDRLNQYLVEACFRLAEDVARCRAVATDKSYSYSYRLACDKHSANYETMIAYRANMLIERLATADAERYNTQNAA